MVSSEDRWAEVVLSSDTKDSVRPLTLLRDKAHACVGVGHEVGGRKREKAGTDIETEVVNTHAYVSSCSFPWSC